MPPACCAAWCASSAPLRSVTAVVNTGDDTVLHGLHISPDLDTVTYTLARPERRRARLGPRRRDLDRHGEPRAPRRRDVVPPRRPRPRHPPLPDPAPRRGRHAVARSPARSAGPSASAIRLLPDVRRPRAHPADTRRRARGLVPGVLRAAAATPSPCESVRFAGAEAAARARASSTPSPTPTWSWCARPTRSSRSARSWPCPESPTPGGRAATTWWPSRPSWPAPR